MTDLATQILDLKHLRSQDIAEQLGCSARYARRVLKAAGHSHPVGPPRGEANPAWVGGRKVDRDGYVSLVRKPRAIYEHRVVAARMLGRELRFGEVVDHIDGITIHNDPSNLRVFASNGEHLRATAAGERAWSERGLGNIGARTDLGKAIVPVDTYYRRKVRGDIRLRSILRAALELGIGHPCLSGTTHWLIRSGIDPESRPSLERAWAELESRFAADLRA